MDAYVGLPIFILCAAVLFCRIFAIKPLPNLPIAGTKDPFLSMFTCIHFQLLSQVQRAVQESYIRFRDHYGAYQLRLIGEWRIVAIGHETVMAVLKSKLFSVGPFVTEFGQLGLNIHPSLAHGYDLNRYIRQMMLKLDDHLPQIISEIEISLKTESRNGAGKSLQNNNSCLCYTEPTGRVNVMGAMSRTVFRALNIIIVGQNLVGNPDYCEQMLRGVPFIFITGSLLQGVPQRLRYIVRKLLSQVFPTCSMAQAIILDEIRDKKAAVNNLDQPWNSEISDILSWAVRQEKLADSEDVLAAHLVLLNLASTLTTMVALTQTVTNLLVRPECLERIQSEIRTVMKDGVITVEALNQLPLLDSFMKESSRLLDFGAFAINRVAEVDATLPNGITVPKGSTVSIPTYLTHRNSKFYDDPTTFDANRFIDDPRMRAGYLADVSPEYIFFGYGKIICPGRHIAIRIMKSVIVKMLLTYDIALCDATRIPTPIWYGLFCVPDRHVMASFEERHIEVQ
ncbi:cytochrome P450 [Suillus spraguei]|nr:cytochrome P450 [Suillus spraguei]